MRTPLLLAADNFYDKHKEILRKKQKASLAETAEDAKKIFKDSGFKP